MKPGCALGEVSHPLGCPRRQWADAEIKRLGSTLIERDAEINRLLKYNQGLSVIQTKLEAENDRLRAYIRSLDGKYVGTSADGVTFLDEGIIVAADILGSDHEQSCDPAITNEINLLRAAIRPFAEYARLNDLNERDPRGALEVPISDLLRAAKALGI